MPLRHLSIITHHHWRCRAPSLKQWRHQMPPLLFKAPHPVIEFVNASRHHWSSEDISYHHWRHCRMHHVLPLKQWRHQTPDGVTYYDRSNCCDGIKWHHCRHHIPFWRCRVPPLKQWRHLMPSLETSLKVSVPLLDAWSLRSELLRSLRHCMKEQSQKYHTIDHLEERDVERGSTRQSSLRGLSSIRQTMELFERQCWENWWDTHTVQAFLSTKIPSWTELEAHLTWTELKWRHWPYTIIEAAHIITSVTWTERRSV